MSILPLLLLVGVAFSKTISNQGNDDTLQPIATPLQARRICAELCKSGLGGEPCGETCLDMLPQELPHQSPNSPHQLRNATRRDACPVLCSNQLGHPLCHCDMTAQRGVPHFEVNYVQICSYFCTQHNYKIYGCQSCQLYKDLEKQHGGQKSDFFDIEYNTFERTGDVDWEAWCKQQCAKGDGGSACNCDILPMRVQDNDV